MATDRRQTLEDLEIQRFFWAPSFEVYGGVAGLFDLGPSGAAIERNLLQKWRQHFIVEEDMCEVRCSMLTPYKVLESSGHTAKFSDFMVTDTVNKQIYRADQLIEQVMEARIQKSKKEEEKAKFRKVKQDAGEYTRDQLKN